MKNENETVIRKMALRSLKSGHRRSIIMVSAVFLSAFLLFSILTVGVTYFKTQKIQNIRLNGGDFDAVLYGLTEKQREILGEKSDVEALGTVAVAGYAIATEADRTLNAGLCWADPVYWNRIMEPARERVRGEYPQDLYDVMVTEELLESCGLSDFGIGDSFPMEYGDAEGTHMADFYICGIWDGYGDRQVFYVSEAFYRQSGHQLSDVTSGRCFLDFRQNVMSSEKQDEIRGSLNLGKQQSLIFTGDYAASVSILAGVCGLILITCFCAYLLIYNIWYISVSGSVRYYGLLQTVGMTGRQIRKLMGCQMLFIGAAGTAAGIAAGSAVSFLLMPRILHFLGIRAGGEEMPGISFHPVVFFLTILLVSFTIWAGGRKPVKMAASVSPVEALGWRTSAGGKNFRKTGRGGVLTKMVRLQLTKDRKKTAVVVMSLAVSLSVFLCVVTLLESQAARTIVSNYMDFDLVVSNDTLRLEERQEREQLISEEMLSEMEAAKGVREIHPVFCSEITVPREPEFSDVWMREFYDMWMTVPYEEDLAEYQEHPENFPSMLVGIDEASFRCLNSTLENPADEEAFLSGETCILYRDSLDFSEEDVRGKRVTAVSYGNPENAETFRIAGLTDENYYTGPLSGYHLTVIVSERALKAFAEEFFVSKVGIRYEQEYDSRTEERLISLIDESPYAADFSLESKIGEMKSVEEAQGGMMETGIGIAVLLALIGILNYINTVIGSLTERQRELAVLESIGMTGGQMKRMLITEGISIAAGALILTATAGTAVTYWLYQAMNYRGIPFSIPVLPAAVAAGIVLLICILIPPAVGRRLGKGQELTERIRRAE